MEAANGMEPLYRELACVGQREGPGIDTDYGIGF
jgi:hypothetical protein